MSRTSRLGNALTRAHPTCYLLPNISFVNIRLCNLKFPHKFLIFMSLHIFYIWKHNLQRILKYYSTCTNSQFLFALYFRKRRYSIEEDV